MFEGVVSDGLSVVSEPPSRVNAGMLTWGGGIIGVAFGVVSGESSFFNPSSRSILFSVSCLESRSSCECVESGSGVLAGGL